jgi:hypothetical protein
VVAVNHTAVNMAHRRNVATQLPAALVWPYDCEQRCAKLVRVVTGPVVGHELTRNLREPFRSKVREQFPA